MIVTTSLGIRTADVYFDEFFDDRNVDVLRYNQWSSPVADAVCTPFYTQLIDLTTPADRIFGAMDKDTRREIRKAEEKDKLTYEFWTNADREVLRQISDLQDEFAALKKLPAVDRRFVNALGQAGVLDMCMVHDPEGKPLIWRTYIKTAHRARALWGGSLALAAPTTAESQLIGRANRFLWWKDMVRYQQTGLQTFDMGGWYKGGTDQEKLRINSFKKEFGGTIVENFNCVRAVSVRGVAATKLAAVRRRWVEYRLQRARHEQNGFNRATTPETAAL